MMFMLATGPHSWDFRGHDYRTPCFWDTGIETFAETFREADH